MKIIAKTDKGADMDIANSTFSLVFQPIPDIRRSAFDIEERLDGYLKPFQVYAIPADAPFELPRIASTTESGHSTLTIAAQSAQVQSNFDDNYSKDFEKSLTYSKKKAYELFNTLTDMHGVVVNYVGLSVQLIASADDFGRQPVEFIKDTYLNVESNLALSDASAKLVYEVDEDYYLNIEVKKVVLADPISISIGPNGVDITSKVTPHDDQLSVIIDFNNRLAFNCGRHPTCSLDTIETLYRRVSAFAERGIENFLEKSEVSF